MSSLGNIMMPLNTSQDNEQSILPLAKKPEKEPKDRETDNHLFKQCTETVKKTTSLTHLCHLCHKCTEPICENHQNIMTTCKQCSGIGRNIVLPV